MTQKRNLLVFRFSALGDVAMTLPVLKLLLEQHPDLHLTFVSNPFVQPLFHHLERVHFVAADLKGKHKGIKGLYRLYQELKQQYTFDAIADLHNVLRTKILRFFFAASGKPIAVIDKGREEKKALTRKENKILRPLKTTFERYAEVFAALGWPVQLPTNEIIKPAEVFPDRLAALKQHEHYLIGVAPFAQHKEKMYPLDKMKEVLRLLTQHPKNKIFLLGGGKKEADLLHQWEQEIPGVESIAGKMNFETELQLIARLHLMVSMDSANMHLASLYGVPVVSVWGATHPFAGFYGWGQSPDDIVQIELSCRPCSVFGNKPCFRGDWACMHAIPPVVVYHKVMEKLEAQTS